MSGSNTGGPLDRLVISRNASTDQGTTGDAVFPGWNGRSIELPDLGNVPDVSCIPAGVYVAKLVDSTLFKRKVYLLQNVPGRTACELHVGNWAGNKSLGYRSDVEGCTVFGTSVGELCGQTAVLNSETALNSLIAATGGADIEVEYLWK